MLLLPWLSRSIPAREQPPSSRQNKTPSAFQRRAGNRQIPDLANWQPAPYRPIKIIIGSIIRIGISGAEPVYFH